MLPSLALDIFKLLFSNLDTIYMNIIEQNIITSSFILTVELNIWWEGRMGLTTACLKYLTIQISLSYPIYG